AFAMLGVDVVSADVWTSADGIAVDTFRIPLASMARIEPAKLDKELRAVVTGSVDIGGRIAQRIRTYSRYHRRAVAAALPRFDVLISNDASATTTMIDVRAPDDIAVLYRLASCLTDLHLDIRSAKVATLGHEVVDVFYVQRRGQVPTAEHDSIRAALTVALTKT
ncbi:MAG TPA: hypothetical protein PLV68_19885, partial [Ilumatobacteraceae bacterium]|nr:hypothetical protein [Ilumatobacteraceae bacterium]